jgi:hypothetical protein
MTYRFTVVLFAVLAALAVAAPAAAGPLGPVAGATDAGVDAAASQANASEANASNASLGASVSAFMQASAAETEGEVDDGMFTAAFNRSGERSRADLVTGRTNTLADRLETLQAERQELLEREGNLTVAERARAARLAARADALQNAINNTEQAAERAGVNADRFDELRENARNLSGPEVAEMATSLVENPGRGPGAAPGDGPEGAGADANVTDGGPPDDPGAGGNGTDANGTDGSGEGNPANGPGDTPDQGDGQG